MYELKIHGIENVLSMGDIMAEVYEPRSPAKFQPLTSHREEKLD